MSNTDSRGRSTEPGYGRYFGLGFAFVVALGVLAALGYFVDRALGTLPLFLLVGLAVGFIGGLYYVYVTLKSMGDEMGGE
jgi:F0F1-type ATP synthase assembly protein I